MPPWRRYKHGRVAAGGRLGHTILAAAGCFICLSLWQPRHRQLELSAWSSIPIACSRISRCACPPAQEEASWVLPTVDKDTTTYQSGRGGGAAWVQTTQNVYVFVPAPSSDEAPKVELKLDDYGTKMQLTVDGTDAIHGLLANAVKPGDEIWMLEDAPDGRSFIVVELDKEAPGREWTSLLQPVVSFTGDYKSLTVKAPKIAAQELEATVNATLLHLQRTHVTLRSVPDEHKATASDRITVDLEGFQLNPDGTRGEPVSGGSAKGQKIDLGDDASGFSKEVRDQLIGIIKGETRDITTTLGSRAGTMSGQQILLSVTCTYLQSVKMLDVGDELAREVKRREQIVQASSEDGLPDEEVGKAEVYTLEELRADIAGEVQQAAEQKEFRSVRDQLKSALLDSTQVSCHWSSKALDDPNALRGEELAAVIAAIADQEGFEVDAEELKQMTWDELGKPKPGEKVAKVGDDPAREFQESRTKVFRAMQSKQVLDWLEKSAQMI